MRDQPLAWLSYLAFTLTGVGTALLGSTLPATLHRWQLADSRGGLLLLAAWGGSTAGALLARGRVDRSAAAGLVLSAGALLGMASHFAALLLPAYLTYGVGLGTTMTSISLLRSQRTTSAQAALELNRLNLLWAVGACCAPLLAFQSLRLLSTMALFRLHAAIFASCAAAMLLLMRRTEQAGAAPTPRGRDVSGQQSSLSWAPLRICLFAAASVGLESALGSWLTTYTERATLAVGVAVSANAMFWTGLLLSRGVHSTMWLRWFHTRIGLLSHLVALVAGLILLLVHPTRGLLAGGGFLCGWGLGPLYPLILSVALPRYRSTLVFVLAGLGASLVPWFTGLLSSSLGSLRLGLLAPAATLGVLLAVTLWMRRELDPGTATAVGRHRAL